MKKEKKKSRQRLSYLIATFRKRKKQKEISQVASFALANCLSHKRDILFAFT